MVETDVSTDRHHKDSPYSNSKNSFLREMQMHLLGMWWHLLMGLVRQGKLFLCFSLSLFALLVPLYKMLYLFVPFYWASLIFFFSY